MSSFEPDDQADLVAKEETAEHDKLMEVDPHLDRTREFKSPAFTRIRTDWEGPYADEVQAVMKVAEGRLVELFPNAFQLINEIYDIVREPLFDTKTGEVVLDEFGWPKWARDRYGSYIEDYTKLGMKEKEHFIGKLTIGLADWQQIAADLWGEAMFAKAHFEEAFALGFEQAMYAKGKTTVEARTQAGRIAAREERYFGIFKSLLSRKADALVSSLTLISQRMKDTYQ